MTFETQMHHTIGIVGIVCAMWIGRVAGPLVLSLMITEISTPFVNVRGVLKELSADKSYERLFHYNGVLLITSFFFSRICMLGLLVFGYVIPTLWSYDWVDA